MTLQYSDAGMSGDQLNTLAPANGPNTSGKVQVSPASTRVPVGKTEMRIETDGDKNHFRRRGSFAIHKNLVVISIVESQPAMALQGGICFAQAISQAPLGQSDGRGSRWPTSAIRGLDS